MPVCLIVEDHHLTLDGTTLALRSVNPEMVVYPAESLAQAQATLRGHADIDLVLLDLDLGDSQGIETLSTLTGWCSDQGRDVRVVVLSGHEEPDLVRAVIENFGTGFILKAMPREIFRHAISLTLAGGVFIPDVLLKRMKPAGAQGRAFGEPDAAERFTPREVDVARLLVRGFTYKRIALRLEENNGKAISEHTVRAHVGNIAWKLGVTENAKAGVMAEIARRGLKFLPPEPQHVSRSAEGRAG